MHISGEEAGERSFSEGKKRTHAEKLFVMRTKYLVWGIRVKTLDFDRPVCRNKLIEKLSVRETS